MYPEVRLSALLSHLETAMRVTWRLCHCPGPVTQALSSSPILRWSLQWRKGPLGSQLSHQDVRGLECSSTGWHGPRSQFPLQVYIISICLPQLSMRFVRSCDPDLKCMPWGRKASGIWAIILPNMTQRSWCNQNALTPFPKEEIRFWNGMYCSPWWEWINKYYDEKSTTNTMLYSKYWKEKYL